METWKPGSANSRSWLLNGLSLPLIERRAQTQERRDRRETGRVDEPGQMVPVIN